jgi:hypothetical protein
MDIERFNMERPLQFSDSSMNFGFAQRRRASYPVPFIISVNKASTGKEEYFIILA